MTLWSDFSLTYRTSGVILCISIALVLASSGIRLCAIANDTDFLGQYAVTTLCTTPSSKVGLLTRSSATCFLTRDLKPRIGEYPFKLSEYFDPALAANGGLGLCNVVAQWIKSRICVSFSPHIGLLAYSILISIIQKLLRLPLQYRSSTGGVCLDQGLRLVHRICALALYMSRLSPTSHSLCYQVFTYLLWMMYPLLSVLLRLGSVY